MTTYNFDREIDRKKTNSLKYDFAVERGRDVDVLPLWVADMDFQAPKPVLDALQKQLYILGCDLFFQIVEVNFIMSVC